MANDSITEQPQSAEPDARLRQLDRLVGTWTVSGGVTGQITFEWLEGGFFLTQRVDLDRGGHRVRGLEVIGRERGFGAEPSEEIKSRLYSSEGETLDVYELDGDTLMIWAGREGLTSVFQGRLRRRRRYPHRRVGLARRRVASSPARGSADEHARTSQTRTSDSMRV
jgi:hypothetical protein